MCKFSFIVTNSSFRIYRDAEGQTPFMLAVNCRAYQAALILFDTIKRVANRECTTATGTGATSTPSHTNVPYFDHLETTTTSFTTPPPTFPEASAVQNAEEKLKNVMNAWFSKDSNTTAAPAAAAAPVITPVHSHISNPAQASSFTKRSGDVDWLYPYAQQPSTHFPVTQQPFDASRSE